LGSDLTGITAHAVQIRVKRPLLELVRREAILHCDADRLVQLTDDFCILMPKEE
jgi:hypothetical protein